MSSSSGLRIGIAGAGAIVRIAHVPALRALDQADIVGIADPDEERANALANECGAKPFVDYRVMLDSSDLDAIVVATPNDLHSAVVCDAAATGLHVFCEKPLSNELVSARRMVEACAEAGVVLQVGFNQRFWPAVERAKELVDDRLIGDVRIFRSVYSEAWDVYPAATQYRYDLQRSGGASMIDLAIHRIDQACHLVGDIAEVCAVVEHTTLPVPVDDTIMILCTFEGGATGVITSDRFSPQVSNATDLYGSEGTIHLSTETINPFQSVPLAVSIRRPLNELPQWLREADYPQAWWKESEPGSWISIIPPRSNAYQREMAAFVDAALGRIEPVVSGDDGLRAQEVVTAAYRSARTQGWVSLPLDDPEEPTPSYGR